MGKTDTQQTAKLLAHLWRGGKYGNVWTCSPDKRRKRTHWLKPGAPLPAISPGLHVYFSVCPTLEARGPDLRTRKIDVCAINALFADFDAKSFESKAAALAHIESLPVPSAIIDSVGGYHCYWLLRDPLILATLADRTRAIDIQRRWVEFVGGDPGAKDIARILRLPGYPNVKAEYAPSYPMVRIVRADFETLYTLEELERCIPTQAPEPTPLQAETLAPPTPAPVIAEGRREAAFIKAAIAGEVAHVRETPEGGRNDALYKAAYTLGGRLHLGADRGTIERELEAAAADLIRDDGAEVVRRTIKSGIDAGAEKPLPMPPRTKPTVRSASNGAGPHTETPSKTPAPSVPHPETPAAPEEWRPARPYTDEGNAERLQDAHGRDLRYCYTWAKWLLWDGRRWAPDDNGEAKRRAKLTVRAMLGEAEHIEDDHLRAALLKHERQSEGAGKLNNMLEAAEKLLPITARELDADPWLLNCMNGTLDLRTGTLRPHKREDFITKLAPVHFDPGATLPAWDRFLRAATRGDQALQDFLQRAAGYSLTGDVSEEVLFFVHGPQAAGKSTFIEALKSALGEYATASDFEVFLSRSFVGGIRNDIARLAGARLVASIEVDEGRKLAEGLLKAITGGDTIAARFLHKEHFEFKPTFKLWLVANHAPAVNPDDGAMWRRLLRVPFENVIPKAERDPKLKAQLTDPSIAGPAILAWAVRGCKAWQDRGLSVPEIVEQATEALRADMDVLADFIAEQCATGPGCKSPVGELRQAFDKWRMDRGEQDRITARSFNERLTSRGYTQQNTNGVRAWLGIGLLAHAEEGDI